MLISRRTVITLFANLLLILAVSACGSDSKDFSYSIENGSNRSICKYQSPHYDSTEEYCKALQNSKLNIDPTSGQECGRITRKGLFESNCSGTFTPTQD